MSLKDMVDAVTRDLEHVTADESWRERRRSAISDCIVAGTAYWVAVVEEAPMDQVTLVPSDVWPEAVAVYRKYCEKLAAEVSPGVTGEEFRRIVSLVRKRVDFPFKTGPSVDSLVQHVLGFHFLDDEKVTAVVTETAAACRDVLTKRGLAILIAAD